MNERGSVWNGIALVATLGLAAVVAIVAVTRSDRESPAPAPSASASPSPTASPTPGGLTGKGPYVVYAVGADVLAYDIDSGSTTTLGPTDGPPAYLVSRQPGGARVVAFPTDRGGVWSVTRRGLERVGAIPSRYGNAFAGSIVSGDDRRLASARLTAPFGTIVVDLQTGRSKVIERRRRDQYPDDALLPIAWSLGGSIVYQVPFCECDSLNPGMYALDTVSGTSTLVPAARAAELIHSVVSSSGQAVYYGTGKKRRCQKNEAGPCEGPPFALRRIAAGRRTSTVLQRSDTASFIVDALSDDDSALLVRRFDPKTRTVAMERYGTEGDIEPSPKGIPAGAEALALLPKDVVVAALYGDLSTFFVVRDSRAEEIVRQTAGTTAPVYLGWLR